MLELMNLINFIQNDFLKSVKNTYAWPQPHEQIKECKKFRKTNI